MYPVGIDWKRHKENEHNITDYISPKIKTKEISSQSDKNGKTNVKHFDSTALFISYSVSDQSQIKLNYIFCKHFAIRKKQIKIKTIY